MKFSFRILPDVPEFDIPISKTLVKYNDLNEIRDVTDPYPTGKHGMPHDKLEYPVKFD